MPTSATTKRPGRPSTRPNEAAIYEAGLAAFAERGFYGASMRDIAKRAGTSMANLYNYVPSKDDLLALLLQRANERLRAALTAALDGVCDPTDRLSSAVRAYTMWTIGDTTAGLVALSEMRYLRGRLRAQVVAARDTTEQLFIDIVDEGVARGDFATPRPRDAARAILLMCATFATWYRPDGPREPEDLAATQSRFALVLVEARDAEGHVGG